MSENLKPCPFCGCKNIIVDTRDDEDGNIIDYYCECMNCGAMSHFAYDRKCTIDAWNTRAYENA